MRGGKEKLFIDIESTNHQPTRLTRRARTKYSYYAGGFVNTEDGPWSNDTVTYTYNNALLRSGLTQQQPTGSWTNGITWDAAHRLTNVTSQAGTFA